MAQTTCMDLVSNYWTDRIMEVIPSIKKVIINEQTASNEYSYVFEFVNGRKKFVKGIDKAKRYLGWLLAHPKATKQVTK